MLGRPLRLTLLRTQVTPNDRTRVILQSRRKLLAKRFQQLAAEWKEKSALLSAPEQIAMLDSYQRIIGIGTPAIPLILRELSREPDHWFWALRAISGVNPVAPEARGNLEAMTAAWLAWGKRKGYRRFATVA